MQLTRKLFKNALEKTINENGFTIVFEGIGDTYLIRNNANSKTCLIQLVISSTVCINRESHEGNEIYSLNFFKLHVPIGEPYPDFFIMASENAVTDSADFIIIPSTTLNEKLFEEGISWKKRVELCFLTYPDGKVFNITSLSWKGRWYLLHKGTGGQMADGCVYDYTEWFNNWNGLSSYYSEKKYKNSHSLITWNTASRRINI